MKSSVETFFKIMSRRSQRGQALLIVAVAMLALIAFTGIAVDVALMFARFSSLRRAVDAAAIATAGHLRDSSDYTSLEAVAATYIRLHGLDPQSVKVELCETEIVDLRNSYQQTNPASTLGGPDALGTLVSRADRAINPPPYDGSPAHPYPSELCSKDPQKIVRVSAQIQSPTTFLSLFGWKNITLETSSVSQTAVLDVALLLDSNLTESDDTVIHEMPNGPEGYACGTAGPTPGTCAAPVGIYDSLSGQTAGVTVAQDQMIPLTDNNPSQDVFALQVTNILPLANFLDFTDPNPGGTQEGNTRTGGLGLLPYGQDKNNDKWLDPDSITNYPNQEVNFNDGHDFKAIRPECFLTLPTNTDNSSPLSNTGRMVNYAWGGCCDDPTIQADPGLATSTGMKNAWSANPDNYVCDDSGNTTGESRIVANGTPCDSTAAANSGAKVISTQKGQTGDSALFGAGFTRDQYPSTPGSADDNSVKYTGGDGNFSDLVCQPFKQVRDAARRFLKKLDFVRGDRAVLVSFDTTAHIYKPDGLNTYPVMTDKTTAVRTLDYLVGVQITPNRRQRDCYSYDSNWNPGNQWYGNAVQCANSNTGAGIKAATSVLTNPAWLRRESVWVMVTLSDGYPNRTPDAGGQATAQMSVSNLTTVSNTVTCDPGDAVIGIKCPCNQNYDGSKAGFPLSGNAYIGSVICTGGSGGPNYGLSSNLTLANSGVTTNMGFCPWYTFCDQNEALCQQYGKPGTGLGPNAPLGNAPFQAGPAGPGWPQPIWYNAGEGDVQYKSKQGSVSAPIPPYCTDPNPDSRHFCSDSKLNINPGGAVACDPLYDAKDYARDQADFAALLNYSDNQPGNFIAMFTIFFDHGHPSAASPSLRENILGIKMLRYMADAGDDGVIENHVQAWYRDQHFGSLAVGGNGTVPPPANFNGSTNFYSAYKAEDPCTSPALDYQENSGLGAQAVENGSVLGVLPAWQPGGTNYENAAKTDCGQFFYANNLGKVSSAFTEIASRLFTRLSR